MPAVRAQGGGRARGGLPPTKTKPFYHACWDTQGEREPPRYTPTSEGEGGPATCRGRITPVVCRLAEVVRTRARPCRPASVSLPARARPAAGGAETEIGCDVMRCGCA
eukprot:4187913-Prymnesium_polylepis.1